MRGIDMDELTNIPAEPKKSKGLMMKILVPIFVVILIIILVLVKIQMPDFPLGYVILIGAIILIVGLLAFFGIDIFHKLQKIRTKEKMVATLPEPVDTKLLWEKVKFALTNPIYRDHIKEYIQTINHSVGKNAKSLVVEFQVRSLYRPRLRCSILINANYPNRLPTVLFEPNIHQLRSAIQSMSFDPEDLPSEEETIILSPMTGTTSTIRKKTYAKKDKDELKAKKEPLI